MFKEFSTDTIFGTQNIPTFSTHQTFRFQKNHHYTMSLLLLHFNNWLGNSAAIFPILCCVIFTKTKCPYIDTFSWFNSIFASQYWSSLNLNTRRTQGSTPRRFQTSLTGSSCRKHLHSNDSPTSSGVMARFQLLEENVLPTIMVFSTMKLYHKSNGGEV